MMFDKKVVLQRVRVQTGGIGAEDDPERVKGAIVEGFLQTDKHLHTVARREGWERGGTTVVATLISPYYIYFANCGDSRAMLCRSGQVCFSTEDHKPTDQQNHSLQIRMTKYLIHVGYGNIREECGSRTIIKD